MWLVLSPLQHCCLVARFLLRKHGALIPAAAQTKRRTLRSRTSIKEEIPVHRIGRWLPGCDEVLDNHQIAAGVIALGK